MNWRSFLRTYPAFLGTTVFLVLGCSESSPLTTYTGYTESGNPRNCSGVVASTCSDPSTDDSFKGRCQQAGGSAYQCGCGDWICSKDLTAAKDSSQADQSNDRSQDNNQTKDSSPDPSEVDSNDDGDSPDGSDNDGKDGTGRLTGYSIDGEEGSCVPEAPSACTAIFGPGDQFKKDCEAAGFRARQCSCHVYLCSQKLSGDGDATNDGSGGGRTGYDLQGKRRSCAAPPDDLMCTMVLTPEDSFGAQCGSKGFTAILCGCHDWLCSRRLDGSGDGDLIDGFDMQGKPKSCTPIAEDTVCTTQATEGDAFGARCTHAGFTATQCACHEYICEKPLPAEPKTFTGYNMQRKKRTCERSEEVLECTGAPTTADKFGQECTQHGGTAFQCACHDWLCSKSIRYP